jgi:hypothetical protein
MAASMIHDRVRNAEPALQSGKFVDIEAEQIVECGPAVSRDIRD